MSLRDRLVDPKSPDRRPRRAAYALPTLFTSGNVFLGFYAIIEFFKAPGRAAERGWSATHISDGGDIHRRRGVPGRPGRPHRAHDQHHQRFRARNGFAGRLHHLRHRSGGAGLRLGHPVRGPSHGWRCSNTCATPATSSASCSCCAAPCVWRASTSPRTRFRKIPDGRTASTSSGLPIPARRALVAAVVYAADGEPLRWWLFSALWLVLLALLAFLMVSTWRYPSFKDIHLMRPRSFLIVIALGVAIYSDWFFSQPVLLAMTVAYLMSGIVVRIGGILRRRLRRPASPTASGAAAWLRR